MITSRTDSASSRGGCSQAAKWVGRQQLMAVTSSGGQQQGHRMPPAQTHTRTNLRHARIHHAFHTPHTVPAATAGKATRHETHAVAADVSSQVFEALDGVVDRRHPAPHLCQPRLHERVLLAAAGGTRGGREGGRAAVAGDGGGQARWHGGQPAQLQHPLKALPQHTASHHHLQPSHLSHMSRCQPSASSGLAAAIWASMSPRRCAAASSAALTSAQAPSRSRPHSARSRSKSS